jgi:hypothetical protein
MAFNCLLRRKCKKMTQQKVAQNVAISLGYFIFSKSSPIGKKLPNVVNLYSFFTSESGFVESYPDGSAALMTCCFNFLGSSKSSSLEGFRLGVMYSSPPLGLLGMGDLEFRKN